jgi:hypothetical protein
VRLHQMRQEPKKGGNDEGGDGFFRKLFKR